MPQFRYISQRAFHEHDGLASSFENVRAKHALQLSPEIVPAVLPTSAYVGLPPRDGARLQQADVDGHFSQTEPEIRWFSKQAKSLFPNDAFRHATIRFVAQRYGLDKLASIPQEAPALRDPPGPTGCQIDGICCDLLPAAAGLRWSRFTRDVL